MNKEDFLFMVLQYYLPFKSLNAMNEVQKTLFLASSLEDICQAGGLPSLSEDKEIFLVLPEIKKAHEKLGALKTAALLDEFISLVPVGTVPEWDWFFEEKIFQDNTTVKYKHQDTLLPEDYNGLGYLNLFAIIFDIRIKLNYLAKKNNAEELRWIFFCMEVQRTKSEIYRYTLRRD